MMKYSKKCIGLIGFGYWGKNILRNLYEMEALHTACDTDIKIVSEYKNKFPNIDNFTTSYEEVLDNSDIKAVAIATPAATHHQLVKQSLLSKKDVFVEKPLALTVKQGKELVELAQRENRILMVGHILQYHPAIVKLKELISSGELGKIQYIYSNRLNIGKLRTEENILWSFAPHDISVILMLLEEEPLEVSAFGGNFLNNNISDTTITTMTFRNEVKSHIFVSWLHPYKEQKLIVVGSKAMAVFDDVSHEKLFIYPHKIEWKNGKIPIAQKADYKVIPVCKEEPLNQELRHFIECILERKRPRTDGFEGLRVLNILESAEKMLMGSPLKTNSKETSYFIHESAYIDEGVKIGSGTKIWCFSHILKNSSIGKNCVIGQNVVIGPDVIIGNKCKIQNNVSVYTGVTLEDGVFCGPSMVFTNVFNPRSEIPRMDEVRPTLVGKGATIGANSTIICGNVIGKYSMVGAGAVVTKDVPDYAIVIGNPAKLSGWMCECGVKLRFNGKYSKCDFCEREYLRNENIVTRKETRLKKSLINTSFL